MSEKRMLRTAVIGQGRSGREIHGKFFKCDGNNVIKVCYVVERDPERRRRAEEEYPGCKTVASHTELYGHDDIDLFVNASYSDEHYSVTHDLLSHGFNVVVEKPFARNRYECDNLIALAKEKGVTLAVFQQSFLAPIYLETRKVLDRGVLGDIKQVSIRYNGLSRRWDWQTLQYRMAGSVYNTGPHPIGFALGLLDFDPTARVVYSKLDTALTSGDAEDYAKIIIAAENRPVVDVEINSTDAFSDYNIKIQGTNGTYKCTTADCKMKYFVPSENTPRPVIHESLSDAQGLPAYCIDDLVIHEEAYAFDGSAFDIAVERFYNMVHAKITEGKPMEVTPEMAAAIISIIEQTHAQNPLPVKHVR